jgi:hypothetical protein
MSNSYHKENRHKTQAKICIDQFNFFLKYSKLFQNLIKLLKNLI